MIKKKFITAGASSWAIIIPKALIDVLGINPETDEMGITLENDVIKIQKCRVGNCPPK